MNSNKRNIHTSQLRGYEVFKALFGHENIGITCQELAERFNEDKGKIYRDLKTIEEAGLAEQLPNKCWRISPRYGDYAISILNGIQASKTRLDETIRRYGIDRLGAPY